MPSAYTSIWLYWLVPGYISLCSETITDVIRDERPIKKSNRMFEQNDNKAIVWKNYAYILFA